MDGQTEQFLWLLSAKRDRSELKNAVTQHDDLKNAYFEDAEFHRVYASM